MDGLVRPARLKPVSNAQKLPQQEPPPAIDRVEGARCDDGSPIEEPQEVATSSFRLDARFQRAGAHSRR